MTSLALRLALKVTRGLAKKVVKSTGNKLDDRIFAPIDTVVDIVDKVLK